MLKCGMNWQWMKLGNTECQAEMNGGFGKQGHQMAVAKFVLKSKYIQQIHFYTVHSIILCIHSKASIKFINPFQICSKITKFDYLYES